jgi:ribose transport system permease protein
MYGLPWPMAVLIVLALGVLTGALNGLLVEVARIDSFIATLGTGTILYALALWHTGGRQMVGTLPDAFYALNGTFVFGLPITAFYVLAITLALWIILEYTPIGRYLYAIGANQRAAELNGIPTRKFVIGAFVTSGALTALAGVLLASKLRIGQASVGLEFLLPALVGAFLGSTTIKPGRVNVWGTIVGVMILAVGISGIQQFGGSFWVEPLFNGTTPVATGLRVFAGVDGEVGRAVNPLLDETFAELSAPPAANSSLKDKITWVFQWLKNKSTQTATQRRLYADDGTTVISTETVSDDGTTYTKGEQS